MTAGAQQAVEKGMMVCGEGQAVETIFVLLSGKLSAIGKAGKIEIGPGGCVGLIEGLLGKYVYSYFTETESVIISFPYQEFARQAHLFSALGIRTGGAGELIASACAQMLALSDAYREVKKRAETFYEQVKQGYEECKQFYAMYQTPFPGSERIAQLVPLEMDEMDEPEHLEYMENVASIPREAIKAFFTGSQYVCNHHLSLAVEASMQLAALYEEVITYDKANAACLLSTEGDSLFGLYENLMLQAQGKNAGLHLLYGKLEKLLEFAEEFDGLDKKLVWQVSDDFEDKMQLMDGEDIGSMAAESEDERYSASQAAVAKKQLENSLEAIIAYAGLPEEKNEQLHMLITSFESMQDKRDGEDESMKLRKQLTKLFYEYYEAVLFKYLNNGKEKLPRALDLFLNYGYMDEHLLSEQQLLDLYYLEQDEDCGRYQIFTMKEWLVEIYEGRHEPSKNEFDMDYAAAIREQKRAGKLSAEKEKAILNDHASKVRFELSNMLASANRVTQGQVLSFCPVFYTEHGDEPLYKLYLKKSRIKEVIDYYLTIDYSCFYRSIYAGPGKTKEVAVYPIVILMPNMGSRGLMWQDLSGVKKDTPARFAFSIFERESLEKLMVSVLGQFRWELCRSVQGIYWNDIRERSMTSEYSDYAQFYRKNRELTQPVKDKIRLKLAKFKNSFGAMFISDYTEWVLYESRSSMRLNKVNREILYKYCPFPKEIREQLRQHPAFSYLVEHYEPQIAKREKEMQEG